MQRISFCLLSFVTSGRIASGRVVLVFEVRAVLVAMTRSALERARGRHPYFPVAHCLAVVQNLPTILASCSCKWSILLVVGVPTM